MSRNYGIGSRDMARAGRMVLMAAARRGEISLSSGGTNSARWNQFANQLKEHGIKRMEHIEQAHVIEYGQELAARCERDEMSPSTAQNYISAVNKVMQMARGDRNVWASPTKDCGIPERDGICRGDKSVSQEDHDAAKEAVSERLAARLDLMREMGLRHKESCLISPHCALAQFRESGMVTIEDGTKGGRPRDIEPSPAAVSALKRAAEIQGDDRSMVPKDMSYAEYSRESYREISQTDINFHGERHAYAQGRYEQLMEEKTGVAAQCPVTAGVEHGLAHYNYLSDKLEISIFEAKAVDREVRQELAEELGHGRWGITNAYLG